MNRNTLIMTAMACLTVIFVATTRTPAHDNADAADPDIGRYQIAAYGYGFMKPNGTSEEESRAWVIDTTTSETWYYTGNNWRRAGKAN